MEMNVSENKKKKKRKVMRDSLESKRKYNLNWYQKLYACYNSPIVKFQWNLVSYLNNNLNKSVCLFAGNFRAA